MAIVRQLKFQTQLNLAGFQSGLAKMEASSAQLSKGLGSQLMNLGGGSAAAVSGLGSLAKSLTGAGAAMVAFQAASSGVRAVFDSIKASSDLNETMSKTDVILGSSSEAVKAFADDYAKKFGLVKGTTLDTASEIGGLAKSLGNLSGDKLADFTKQFTGLAADVSSIKNIDMKSAADAIRVGLSGEQSDVLKSMGIVLLEDTVKAYAFANGIAKAGEKLTESQKFAARGGLILKGLAFASGDLERTIDGPANAYRKFTGTIENLSAEFGTALMPAVKSALGAANEGAASLGRYFEANRPTIEAFGRSLSASFSEGLANVKAFGSTALSFAGEMQSAYRSVGAELRAAFGDDTLRALGRLNSAALDGMSKMRALAGFTLRNLGDIGTILGDKWSAGAGKREAGDDQISKDAMARIRKKEEAFHGQFLGNAAGLGADLAGSVRQAMTPGSTDALLGGTSGLGAAMAEGMKKAADEVRKSLVDFASGVKLDVMTPMERYDSGVAKLNEAFAAGLIGADQLGRATDKLFEQTDLSKMLEAANTPAQKFEAAMVRIREATEGFAISAEDNTRLIGRAWKDSGLEEMSKARFGGATDANSREGYSAILAATARRSAMPPSAGSQVRSGMGTVASDLAAGAKAGVGAGGAGSAKAYEAINDQGGHARSAGTDQLAKINQQQLDTQRMLLAEAKTTASEAKQTGQFLRSIKVARF